MVTPEPGERPDPFGTAQWRATVLAGWSASPTRFREDANAEEDFARGAYRDRLVTELAQNAADAAAVTGAPGRLLLRLSDGVLLAANTGRGLDADGVRGLATLRASGKRPAASGAAVDAGGSVGRFGVGFAAVLAVTDEPAVVGRSGGVAFSAAGSAAAVEAMPELADELARRDRHVPVLRLPFPAEQGEVPDGYDTVVLLPLRDPGAAAWVTAALAAIDDALLLALPALAEIRVELDGHVRSLTSRRDGAEVVVHDDGQVRRWLTATDSGRLDPELLADRPVEERQRPGWSVTWALPVDDDGPVASRGSPFAAAERAGSVPAVLHAPTPTEEPVSLPALLIVTVPLEPGRRHVVTGPLTDWLLKRAAQTYAELVQTVAERHGARALTLVPLGLASGALDAALVEAVLRALRHASLVPVADDPAYRVEASAAHRVEPTDEALTHVLAEAMTGLAAPGWSGPAMDALGSPARPLADVLDDLAGVHRDPAWWSALYDALDAARPDRDLLDGLPVPLADGRVVRGPRGVVLPEDAEAAQLLAAVPGLRVAAAGAAHTLLTRLGAVPGDPASLLGSDVVRAASAASLDLDDPEPVAAALLGLVSRSGASRVDGLEDLALRTAAGDWAPASQLLLPGSPLADITAALADDLVHEEWVEQFGAQVLHAVGVADTFPVRTVLDQPLDPDVWDGLVADGGGWATWVEDLVDAGDPPPLVPEAELVLRLDEVDDAQWPRAAMLLREGAARDAIVRCTRIVPVAGAATDVASPAAWWLREAPLFGGRTPTQCRTADADPLLVGLYDPVPVDGADRAEVGGDAAWLAAVGVRTALEPLLADVDGVADLLDRLADARREVGADQLVELYRRLASVPRERWPEAPQQVRVVARDLSVGQTQVVPGAEVTVAVSPLHVGLVEGVLLAGSPVLASLLDVASTEHWSATAAPTGGLARPLPAGVAAWGATAGVEQWFEHDDLQLGGVSVDAWVDPDGTVHAATLDGLARALAWAGGQWEQRYAVAQALADPGALAQLRVDTGFE